MGVSLITASAATKERFRSLVEPELPRLYALARRLVGDAAEDAVQMCLMNAYTSFDRLRDESAFSGWLTRILVNCCNDIGRGRSRHPVEVAYEDVEDFSLFRKIADEDPFPYSDSLHLDFLHRFQRSDVRKVLELLPAHYRVPLVLVHMQGYATKEVAKILDVPLGTVLARLHRGRKLFERKMWDYAKENDMLKAGAR